MREGGLHGDHGFGDDVLDAFPNVDFTVVLFDVVEDVVKVSLVPTVLFTPGLVVVAVFVDSVVCEVHEDVLEVALQWAFVRDSSESGKSFFVYENSKGADTVDKDVDSKIELQAIDEKRFVEVPLDNVAIGFSKA